MYSFSSTLSKISLKNSTGKCFFKSFHVTIFAKRKFVFWPAFWNATFLMFFFFWLMVVLVVYRYGATYFRHLRVRAVFDKTVRVCHVYCNFKLGFTCRSTVIFWTLKDGSLLINTLASNICFSYRNMFQNGVDALSKIVDAFLSKSSKF